MPQFRFPKAVVFIISIALLFSFFFEGFGLVPPLVFPPFFNKIFRLAV